MEKTELQINGLTQSQASIHSSAFILLLKEINGPRTLPIVIAHPEAQSIAIELEKMKPKRPFTHDLFKTFASAYGIDLKEVIIYDLKEGIFYAKLICDQAGNKVEIDSRTSDAVALAVRFNCPVYTYEFILRLAGTDPEKEAKASKEPDELKPKKAKAQKVKTAQQSIEELELNLEKALEVEDYEKASKIRDQINRIKNQQ
jgi:bifunctional DNase/RNase